MTVQSTKFRPAMIMLAAALFPSAVPAPAAAQTASPQVSYDIPEVASDVTHARVQAIDAQTRQVALANADGRTVTVIAVPQIQLGTLSIGDRVNAHYYRSVAFLVSPNMQVSKGGTVQLPPAQAELLARQTQARIAGGYSVPVTQISGLVVGIRPAAHTIDVVNPTGGQIYTIHTNDPARDALMQSLKVGDMVTAVVSPPIATSIEPEKGLLSDLKNLFKQ